MKPIIQLMTSTAPAGVSGRWDWAKAASIAAGLGACTLLGGVFLGQQAGLLPDSVAGALTASIAGYALAKFGLKAQAGNPPVETPLHGPWGSP